MTYTSSLRARTVPMSIMVVACAALAGCHGAPTALCPPYGWAGGVVQVAVRDAVTNQPAAAGAVLVAQEHLSSGMIADTVGPGTDSLYLGIGTAAGNYDLTITKKEYATWTDAGVSVAMMPDGCHPVLTYVDANLQPEH